MASYSATRHVLLLASMASVLGILTMSATVIWGGGGRTAPPTAAATTTAPAWWGWGSAMIARSTPWAPSVKPVSSALLEMQPQRWAVNHVSVTVMLTLARNLATPGPGNVSALISRKAIIARSVCLVFMGTLSMVVAVGSLATERL